jgi:hypothetical protein
MMSVGKSWVVSVKVRVAATPGSCKTVLYGYLRLRVSHKAIGVWVVDNDIVGLSDLVAPSKAKLKELIRYDFAERISLGNEAYLTKYDTKYKPYSVQSQKEV